MANKSSDNMSTVQSKSGSSDAQVCGDNLVSILLSRFDSLAADVKSIKDENQTLIKKVDLSEKYLKETLAALQSDNLKNKKEIIKLRKENNLLKRDNQVKQIQLYNLEQFTRYNGVRIANIPFSESEDLNEIVEIICKYLGFNRFNSLEYFRIKLKNAQYTPSIIVKFQRQTDKESFMKLLRAINFKLSTEIFPNIDRKQPIYFSENMSPFYSSLYRKSRALKNNNIIKFTWFRNNRLFIKRTELSEPVSINCEEDLQALTGQEGKLSHDIEASDQDTDISETSSRASLKKRKLKLTTSSTLDSFFRPSSSQDK